jgi:hypothetical protein
MPNVSRIVPAFAKTRLRVFPGFFIMEVKDEVNQEPEVSVVGPVEVLSILVYKMLLPLMIQTPHNPILL